MEDYKLKATSPQQYDSQELDWRIQGDVNHSSRLYFRSYLVPTLEDLEGKSVIDIGSGVGQLFPTLMVLGASDIQGLEPSKRNVEHSKSLYPEIPVHEGTLQDFVQEKSFDVVICLAVFEHILDINDAFARIAKITKSGGDFYLAIGDKDHNTKSHPNKQGFIINIDVQELGDGVVATKTIYEESILYDIFRPLQSVIDIGTQSGFELTKNIDMGLRGDQIAFHLLVFKRL